MSGCACSNGSDDACKCVELEQRVEELQEVVGAYQIALERLSEVRGKKSGLHYGRDGLEKIRSIAREALSA